MTVPLTEQEPQPHAYEFNGGPVCWCGTDHPKRGWHAWASEIASLQASLVSAQEARRIAETTIALAVAKLGACPRCRGTGTNIARSSATRPFGERYGTCDACGGSGRAVLAGTAERQEAS